MLTQLQVPGFSSALMGLDWLTLPGLESERDEIKQLGRGHDAAWQFVWKGEGQAESSVALVSRRESPKRPTAAAALVRAVIDEDFYLTLIKVGEDNYWLFAVCPAQSSMGIKRVDRVGPWIDVSHQFKDLLNGAADVSKLPIYTDQQERLAAFPYLLDVRDFNLQILAESLDKRDFAKSGFTRHTSLPIVPMLVMVAMLIGACAYYLHDLQAQETAQRDAALARERAIAQRKQELAQAVNNALNATVPARVSVSAYLEATRDLKRLVAGWRLTGLECSAATCSLTYQAQAFATWAGYLAAKPASWPAPTFDNDTQKVTQPLTVQMPSVLPRTMDALPTRDAANQKLGNLAQVSKMLGLNLTLPSAWARVAGNAAVAVPEESWIPMSGVFNAAGAAMLLGDLAARLPVTSGVASVTFKLDDPLTFDLKGIVYANP